jgi:hypothetical protein
LLSSGLVPKYNFAYFFLNVIIFLMLCLLRESSLDVPFVSTKFMFIRIFRFYATLRLFIRVLGKCPNISIIFKSQHHKLTIQQSKPKTNTPATTYFSILIETPKLTRFIHFPHMLALSIVLLFMKADISPLRNLLLLPIVCLLE